MSSVQLPKLSKIYFDQNNLTIYNQSHFKKFTKLSLLSLRNNYIKRVYLTHSNSLTVLELRNNNLEYIPKFCTEEGSYFPKLSDLDLDHNYIKEISKSDINCLKQLKS